MASKRVAKWPKKDREWLQSLPANELEVALLLIAHLDAAPVPEETE